MSAGDSKRNPLTESAILLAAITSIFYCSSYAHYSGFLITLDLDQNVLDRNFQQTIYDGFLRLTSLKLLAWALVLYPALRFLYSHATFPSINLYLKRSISNKKKFLKLRRRWFGKVKDSEVEKREKSNTLKTAGYCIAFIAFIFVLAHFEAQGKQEANSILHKINSHELSASDVIKVKIDETPKTLVYLTCGARNCAGMDAVTGTVYYFPQNGHSFVFPLPSPDNKKATNGNS